MIMILALFAFLVGCTSAHDLMNGRYEVVKTAEKRSPFGTNITFGKLDNCKKELGQYVDCKTVQDWTMVSSQGQGGQIAAGALNAVGLGVLGALMPKTSASSGGVTQTLIVEPRSVKP